MPILNMNYGANKGGANIGEPTNISATATADSATITWTDNDLNTIPQSTFFKSVLVRKIGSAPTSPSDGTLVETETVKNTYSSNGYTDTGLTTGTTYYYQVFSYSDTGGITYGTPISVTPQGGWDMDNWTLAQTSSALANSWWGGVSVNSDGTKIFLSQHGYQAGHNGRVYEVTLSTPYDLSTMGSFDKYMTPGYPEDINFSPDGTKLFVLDDNGFSLSRYDLSTAWDISTATKVQTYSDSISGTGLYISPDGTKVWITGDSTTYYLLTLSTARDISSGVTKTSGTQSIGGRSIWLGNSGKFVAGQPNNSANMNYATLTTPYDLSTHTDDGSENVGTGRAYGIWFDNNGTMCFMVGGAGSTNYVTKYTL